MKINDNIKKFLEIENIQKLITQNRFEEVFNFALNQNIDVKELSSLFKSAQIETNINCDLLEKNFYQNKIDSFIKNKNLKIIEDKYFFNNYLLKEVNINDNIECLGNHCFEGCKNLETISFNGKGLLKGVSGSYIFNGCTSLKRVNSDNIDVLHYKHDNFGTPFVNGVKIFVNNKEIIPLQMKIEYVQSTWNINGGYTIEFDNKSLIKISQIGEEKQHLTQEEYFKIVEFFNDNDRRLREIHISDASFDSYSYKIQYNYIGWENTFYFNEAFKEKEPNISKKFMNIIDFLNKKF